MDRLASECVAATAWMREILCSLRMMQRADAGMPNAAASVIRVAVSGISDKYKGKSREVLGNSQMSHHMGALFTASSDHTMEFTN